MKTGIMMALVGLCSAENDPNLGKEECKGGNMKVTYEGGASYDGACALNAITRAGQREGKGTYIYEDGSKYAGNWANDERNGFGSYFMKTNGMFWDGVWKNGKQNGNGFVYRADGAVKYLGKWEDGQQVGDLRETTFREIENLQFYSKEGDVDISKQEEPENFMDKATKDPAAAAQEAADAAIEAEL